MVKAKKEQEFYGLFSAGKHDGSTPVTLAKQIAVTTFLAAAYDGDESYHRCWVICTAGGRHGVFDDKEKAADACRLYRDWHGKDRWGCTVTRYGVGKCNYKGEILLSTKDFSNPKYILKNVDAGKAEKLLDPANVEKAIILYNKTVEHEA